MSRYTSAYSSFLERLGEVEIFVRVASGLEKRNAVGARDEIRAYCRGAVVLLSSHIEGYVKDLGELILDRIHDRSVHRSRLVPRFFYEISKSRFDEIKDTADPAGIATKVFEFLANDAEIWDTTTPFPFPVPADRFLKGFSNPSVDKICAFAGRFGYGELRRDLRRSLKSDFLVYEAAINNIVGTRNNIAHGNLSANSTPSDVFLMVSRAKVFCREVDDAFAAWARVAICTIR